MKIIVCGGRDYLDYPRLKQALDALHSRRAILRLIEGGARGADTMGRIWATEKKIPYTEVPAEWGKHGKKAGHLRNLEMLEHKVDLVVAFPGGVGTAHMIEASKIRGVPVWIPYKLRKLPEFLCQT